MVYAEVWFVDDPYGEYERFVADDFVSLFQAISSRGRDVSRVNAWADGFN